MRRLLIRGSVVVTLALATPVSPMAVAPREPGQQAASIPILRQAGPKVAALSAEADQLGLALRFAEAQVRVDEAIAEAERTGNRLDLAVAHAVQGVLKNRMGRYPDAIPWLERALGEYEALGNRRGVAFVLSSLTSGAASLRDTARTREYGNRALQIYGELGDDRGRGFVLLAMTFSGESPELASARIREVLTIAERVGDDALKGGALKHRGSQEFSAGNLSAAQTSLEAAIVALDRAGHRTTSAAASLQLGRVHRAHGDHEGALRLYQRAIDMLGPTDDRQTLVEAVNASAVALGLLNRQAESIAAYERGLVLATESGKQVLIDFMTGNLAGGLLRAGQYERAIPILRDVLGRNPTPYIAAFRHGQLAIAFGHLGRWAEALPAQEQSVRITRELKQVDQLDVRLDTRAWILAGLGRFEEALADSREALTVTDQIRSNLVPSDFLKQGYGDRVAGIYSRGVDLLSQMGRGREALEMAEQGRSRAFLDLLAARESTDLVLATRGEAPSPPPVRTSAALRSDGIGQPVSASGMAAIAKRLGSTILTYWVGDDTTLIWVLTPDGGARDLRVPLGRERIGQLVAATTAPLRQSESGVASRGQAEDVTALPLRGIGLMALARDDRAAWRELYKALVEPVRANLPARGGRVTIVPHGPLFQLSFAALQTSAGRYLIEDFDLHYAPAVSALEFTSRRQTVADANAAGPWALVGDPATLPVVGKKTLAPLPGAARELAAIAALAPSGKTIHLNGARADETALVRMLDTSHPAVVHFATHGFVFDDPKTPPFLVLNRRGEAPSDDGRLTLDEVYGLTLTSDLVVLSACRSGSGKVSSDGIVGLTRGFFYAGTPSVMATFWDVTDETTAILMPAFYRQYVRAHQKSASLRTAQLALLADLRAGRVVVTASGRRVTLPEHPLLWAAFFLSGEP